MNLLTYFDFHKIFIFFKNVLIFFNKYFVFIIGRHGGTSNAAFNATMVVLAVELLLTPALRLSILSL